LELVSVAVVGCGSRQGWLLKKLKRLLKLPMADAVSGLKTDWSGVGVRSKTKTEREWREESGEWRVERGEGREGIGKSGD